MLLVLSSMLMTWQYIFNKVSYIHIKQGHILISLQECYDERLAYIQGNAT